MGGLATSITGEEHWLQERGKRWKKNNASASSFMSSQSDGNNRDQDSHARARDVPVKRNLNAEFDRPGDTRTGGQNRRVKGIVFSPSKEKHRGGWPEERDLRHEIERKKERDLREQLKAQQWQREYERKQYEERSHWERGSLSRGDENGQGYHSTYPQERKRGYYVRKPRQEFDERRRRGDSPRDTPGSRKRRPRQMWVPKADGERHEGDESFIRDTRQKTSSVFDRIEETDKLTADPATGQGRREQ